MPLELECKFRVASHEPIAAALKSAGASCLGRVLETNHILDTADQQLRSRGSALRIREIRVLEGPDRPATMTFKGPRHAGPFKQREEIEFDLADSKAMLGLLSRLGFVPQIVFEKRRQTWRLGPCEIVLDELPRLGRFVEVEGPDEPAIRAAMAQLHLPPAAEEPKTYLQMIAEAAGPAAPAPIVLRFDPNA